MFAVNRVHRLLAAVLIVTMAAMMVMAPRAEAQVPKADCSAGTFTIGLIKYGTQATDAQIRGVMGAVKRQMLDNFSPDWHRCVTLYYAPTWQYYIAGTYPVYLTTAPACTGSYKHHNVDCSDYSAFHDVNTGVYPVLPYAWIPDAGAGYNPNDLTEYSTTVSHEVLEIAGNPFLNSSVNGWGGPIGWNQFIDYETELADPVETTSEGYTKVSEYNGQTYAVSNYVLPSWFNYWDTSGVYDASGKYGGNPSVSTPLTLRYPGADCVWYFYPYNNGNYYQSDYTYPWGVYC